MVAYLHLVLFIFQEKSQVNKLMKYCISNAKEKYKDESLKFIPNPITQEENLHQYR